VKCEVSRRFPHAVRVPEASGGRRWRGCGIVVALAALACLAACSTTPPAGIVAVTPFEVTRYAGKWYEIARFDSWFERGLSNVNATYNLRPDGSVEVVNRGYDAKANAWRQAIGRASFAGDPDRGSLRVSFFEPFSAGYHVVALDQRNYQWAMVVGPTRGYLWILSRERQLPAEVRAQLLEQATRLGIDTGSLVWVEHTRTDD